MMKRAGHCSGLFFMPPFFEGTKGMFSKTLFWPTVITISALIILVCLGTWQVNRLGQKTTLLDQINSRFDLPAKPLPTPDQWQNIKKPAWNFTPVSLSGQFDHDFEFHVFTYMSDDKGRFKGAGYLVMTPFKLESSEDFVLVNRGFVPERFKQQQNRTDGLIEENISLEGVLRFSEQHNIFTPAPDMAKNIWFVRDAGKMAATIKGRNFAPFFIELRSSSHPVNLPLAHAKKPSLNNNHLSYALTWYGMACGLLVIFALYVRRTLKEKRLS